MDQQWLEGQAVAAVRHFWRARRRQALAQGGASGVRDAGNRTAVTGGSQMDGFVGLAAGLIHQAGITRACIYHQARRSTHLPGFYRPSKNWDLIVVADGRLLACMEFKSQVGSFGNNFNNRTEEAIGSAQDFWTAYREGAFPNGVRPWLGYFMLLQDAPGSISPVSVQEPHFKVFPEFRGASYAERYKLLCRKLVRERLYDGACLLLSDQQAGRTGQYRELDPEVALPAFAASLYAHASAQAKFLGQGPSR